MDLVDDETLYDKGHVLLLQKTCFEQKVTDKQHI